MVKTFIISLLIIISSFSNAQWISLNGPGAGYIFSVSVSGESIYAGTDNFGLWISTNHGINWSKANFVSSPFSVYALASKGNDVYAAGYDQIYYSSNKGINWTSVNNFNTSYINALTFCGNNIFAGTNNGMFLSTNNGTNWTKINNGLSDTTVLSLCTRGDSLYAGTTGGVYFSPDFGINWYPVNNGISTAVIKSLASDENYIYAGTTDRGVYQSADNGLHWDPVNNGLTPNVYILDLNKNGGNIYAGTYNGLFISSDNGVSWRRTAQLYDVYSIGFYGNDILAGSGNGIYISVDNGITWKNTGLPLISVGSMTSIDSTIFILTGNYIYFSTNNGTEWNKTSGVNSNSLECLYSDGEKLLAGTRRGVNTSSDNGASWTNIGPDLDIYSIALSSNKIFVGINGGGMLMSSDNGAKWSYINSGFPGNFDGYTIAIDGNYMYAGTTSGLYKSSNEGTFWTKSLSYTDIHTITSVNNYVFAGSRSAGIFCSTDNGNTWQQVNTGLTNLQINKLGVKGNTIMAGTGDGIYTSTNYGADWKKTGLSGLPVYSYTISGNDIYAGTGFGIWKRPLSEIVNVENEESSLPKKYILSQNYPNPFNPTTRISYSLPEAGKVTLKVYDILGKEIAILTDEFKNAGNYEVRFDASQIPSGIYIYRISAGSNKGKPGFTTCGKMAVVK